MEAQSKVLTLVFTDLADSTGLKTAHGDLAVGELITRHRDHVTRLAAESAGRVIGWAGDGCFLTFNTSSAAVMFALRLQEAHAEEPDLPGVRVGIHMGEVTEEPDPEGDDKRPRIEGLAVDLAARIQGLARPGQVLMSAAVYQSARQRLGVDAFGTPLLWQAYGDYTLKGYDEPLDICEAGLEGLSPLQAPDASEKAYPLVVASQPEVEVIPPRGGGGKLLALGAVILIVAGLGAAYWFGRSAQRAPGSGSANEAMTSLAVLPLENLMNDPEQDYFVDGMTEAITAELGKITALKVVSRTSVMRYKGTATPVPEIAAELGVEGLVEGSVLREGDEVRITVQLIDGRSDTHLWSESYTGGLTSVFELQSTVALAIADEIRITLTPDERNRIADAREVDPEAYNFFLQAESGLTDISPSGLQRVHILLDRAIEIDPNFAEAWARLGTANILTANLALGSRREYFDAAHRATSRAVELDPSAGRPHAELAFIEFLREQDWEGARARLASAAILEPNAPSSYMIRSYYDATVGDWDHVKDSARRVLELDPYTPFSATPAALMLVTVGYPEEGLPVLDTMASLHPGDAMVQYMTSIGYMAADRMEKSLHAAEQFLLLTGNGALARVWQCNVLAVAGRVEEARTHLEAIERTVQANTLSGTNISLAYARIGDIDKAIGWLRAGAEDPNFQYLVSLRVIPYVGSFLHDPNMVRLRTDPRYRALIEEENFPPFPPEHPGYEEEQARLASKATEAQQAAPDR